jgi:hypothetical protein
MKNCEDKRLCNSNLVPQPITKTLPSKIGTYVKIGPIDQWYKRLEHLVNSCGMEKSLNGTSNRPHIVRRLACAEARSAKNCIQSSGYNTNLTSNWRLVRNKSCLRISRVGNHGSLISCILSLFLDLVRISKASEHVATMWSGMPGIVHML